jgi:hypothetical protein
MLEIALAGINSFASPAPTADFVQALLGELQALREEVARLQGDNQSLHDHLTALETQQEADEESFALDIAHDRRRITKLEAPTEPEPKEITSKVDAHLWEIYNALLARETLCEKTAQKINFMAFWEVEELLGLSHRRVSQLAEIAANDPRFIIAWHPKKHHMKVFKINQFGTLGQSAKTLSKISEVAT